MSEVKMEKSSLESDILRKKYPPNSYKSKQEKEKKIEKVATGNVKKKPSFLVNFFENDFDEVIQYIFQDVLLPAAKRMLADALNNGLEMLLFDRRNNSTRGTVEYVSYNGYSKRNQVQERSRSGRLKEITFASRSEAEIVLENLYNICEEYGLVSVADFYDLAGIPGEFTDNKYGWRNVEASRIRLSRDGYIIELPRPRLLGD